MEEEIAGSRIEEQKFYGLDSRQAELHDSLFKLYGEAPAGFFRDFCIIENNITKFKASTHIKGHLLRELLIWLVEFFLQEKTLNKENVKKIIDKNQWSEYLEDKWLSFIDIKPHKQAHQCSDDGGIRKEEDSKPYYNDLLEFISILINDSKKTYNKQYDEIDELIGTPNNVVRNKLIAKLKVPLIYKYFYDNNGIEIYDWLNKLNELKQFCKPPIAGFWGQSKYLFRMAKKYPNNAKVISKISKIITETKTENPSILYDFTNIASHFEKENLTKFISKVVSENWLQYHPINIDGLLKLATYAIGEKNTSGFEFLGYLAKFEKSDNYNYIEPLIGNHYFLVDFISQELHKIIELAPEQSFDFLMELLFDANSLYNETRKNGTSTSLWLPEIGEGDQYNDYLYSITNRTISTACILIDKKICTLETIIELLEKKDLSIFKRIAIYLLTLTKYINYEIANKILMDKKIFDNSEFRSEYFPLLRKHVELLDEAEKQEIMEWIFRGPGWSEPVTENQKKYWLVESLEGLGKHIPSKYKKTYSQYKKDVGKIKKIKTGIMVGPNSPYNVESILNHSDEWLSEKLSSIKWFDFYEMKTPEGFSRILGAAIQKNPKRFSHNIDAIFVGKHPIYIRALFDGLTTAIEQKDKKAISKQINSINNINWSKMFNFIEQIMNKPWPIPEEIDKKADWCHDWKNTKIEILRFLKTSLWTNLMPFEFRNNVFKIIERFSLEEDNPKLALDSKNNIWDSILYSIQGSSLVACLQYTLWVCRNLKMDGFTNIPEAKIIFENNTTKKYYPIKAFFGRYFINFYYVDKEWLEKHVVDIFDPSDDDLYLSAWFTYIAFTNPPNSPILFELLKKQYEKSLQYINYAPIDHNGIHQSTLSLLDTIFYLYLHSTEEDDFLTKWLDKFYSRTNDLLCGESLLSLRRILNITILDQQKIKRLEEFWEKRMSRILSDPQNHGKEISEFINYIFTNQRLNNNWCLSNLEKIANLNFKLQYYISHEVLDRLALISQDSGLLERIVDFIIVYIRNNDSFCYIEKNDRRITDIIVRAKTAGLGGKVSELINYFSTIGHPEFRNI